MASRTKTEKIKAPRGTQDIYGDQAKIWHLIEDTALRVLDSAGFDEIKTPSFESTSLFSRAVGEDSDIVSKEMYTFLDKSERSMTLRPEGTAGVVRAYIENALERSQKPVKLWYRGPMFRYERPQTGRYRQFHQIGVETFGLEGPYIDLEIIALGWKILENLGLKNLTLYINSLGSPESRVNYREVLKSFLAPLQEQVCDDCKRRFEQNPLRALDCKVPADQELYKNAPNLIDHLDEKSSSQWQETKAALKNLNISFVEDPKLVRGLDYYSHTVFEIKADDPSLGQQSTVLAGGRYDSLVENLGGKESPATGWALGIERLAILLASSSAEQDRRGAYVISDSIAEAQKLAIKIRAAKEQNLPVQFDFDSAKITKQIDKADKKNCRFVIFYLQDERDSGKFKVKDLEKAQEIDNLSFEELLEILK